MTPCSTNAPRFYAAAFLDTFDPDDLCHNYLGEMGGNVEVPGSHAFSFVVPTSARFEVVVEELPGNSDCSEYRLEVYGLPCPTPRLDIASLPESDQVLLQWPTSAAGFRLESSAAMQNPGEFAPILTAPVVVDGKYSVTNESANGAEFFRLHKP
jgi:hypothetical protein